MSGASFPSRSGESRTLTPPDGNPQETQPPPNPNPKLIVILTVIREISVREFCPDAGLDSAVSAGVISLLLARQGTQYALFAVVGPSSVRCPSRGHISKTKQDRPIVTMKHY